MKQPWKKVLYLNQEYLDNFVPDSFLNDTKRNVFVRTYDYWSLVKSSVIVSQQICVVSLFVFIWWHMVISTQTNVVVTAFSCLIMPTFGYFIYIIITPEIQKNLTFKKLLTDFTWSLLLLGICLFMSPILKTLTHTVSADTLYAMSATGLAMHLLFHDYDTKKDTAVVASRSTSLNSAVFAAVCLASRLETTSHCFVTIVLALILFGLWPFLKARLWEVNPQIFRFAVHFIQILLSVAWMTTSFFVSFIFSISCFTVTIIFPLILVWLQPCKDNVHGPWDEAIIKKEE